MHCACRFSPSHRSSRRCAVNSVSPALRSGYPVGHLVRRGGHDRFAPGRPAGCRGSGRCRVAAGCLGLGAARRHAGCYDPLRRNRRNGCGRSGDPAGNAGAGRPLAAASHRSWHHIYTNGLLVGEILPVALFPLLFPLLGESWRCRLSPSRSLSWRQRRARRAHVSACRCAGGPPARDIWRLGLIFAGSSAVYFGSNAFLPGYERGGSLRPHQSGADRAQSRPASRFAASHRLCAANRGQGLAVRVGGLASTTLADF